ncbi:Peptidyl-prolyl cis-tran isomerase 1 [Taenia crassiceps]|uniref:Peptidyl-prolyl cis-tran isomerase 1 n=1 Tax=Taenia crassiceps TaxID=6207 RepID=A0ABR4QPX4_9CEST
MVFGHVLSGREVVAKIEAVPVSDTRIYKPIKSVVIVNCGELVPVKKKKSDEQKKSSKKKKKKSKKSKKKKSRRRRSSSFGSDSDSVKIRPEEIPDVPKNKFLYRPSPTNSNKASYVENQNYSVKQKSGRKVKGRGQVRYRTPDSRSGSRDRGITPEHWHQAARRSRRRSPEDDSRSRAKRFREQIASSREENDVRDVRTRSPLNATERAPVKNHNDYSSVINRPSPQHQESAKTMSPSNTSSGRRDRSRDRAQRQNSWRSDAGIFGERWTKEPEATSPSVRRQYVDDPSSEVDDVRHGYHQQRTPSPPPPPQASHGALSRGQNRSRAEGGGRYAGDSRRSSKSGCSPSPSSHRVSDRKRQASRSPSRSRSPSFTRPSKRSNEREVRRDSPSITAKSASIRRRESSQNRLGSAERQKASPGRGDFHGSPRSPPPHLISKWEERRKQVLRKRDSLLKGSRRRDVSHGSPPVSPRPRHSSSSSRSRSSPRHSKVVASTRHSSPRSSKRRTRSPPSSRSSSPIKSKADHNTASKEASDSALYDAALPTDSTSPLNIPLPPEPSSAAAVSGEQDHSLVDVASREESQKEAVSEEPTATGPWTTSRWQADDELEKDAATSELNTPAKMSSVKLAIRGSSETPPAVPVSIDMDVSDNESAPKASKNLPINDSKGGSKAPLSEALVENKPPALPVSSPKPAMKPKSRMPSSSASSPSSTPGADRGHFVEEGQVDVADEVEVQVDHALVAAAASVVDVITSVLALAVVVIAVAVVPVAARAHGVEGHDPIRIDHVVGGIALRIHVDVDARTPRIPVHRAVHTRPYRVVEGVVTTLS